MTPSITKTLTDWEWSRGRITNAQRDALYLMTPHFLPMLCHRYADHKHKLTYPLYVQPKLNGIRLLSYNGELRSRSYGLEEPVLLHPDRLQHIRKAINSWFSGANILLDGELYHHGWSLQKINGSASVKSATDRHGSSQLEYHIFDCVFADEPFLTFEERWIKLCTTYSHPASPAILLVSTSVAYDERHAESLYRRYKDFGYEGSIYRQAHAPYGFIQNCSNKENRWSVILKRKDWLDLTCPIDGWSPGEGKYDGLIGSLQLRTPDGNAFFAGSGLSDAERSDLIDTLHQARSSGRRLYAKIRFEAWSDDGIPLQPRIECIE